MSNQEKPRTLFGLFLQCLYLSAFTFGGGSTIIALLQEHFVEKLKWIDRTEMLEMVTLAQSAPGATSVNTAVLMGYRIFGVRGALVSALGTSLPPLIVIVVITAFYDWIRSNAAVANGLRGVRACAAALVASVALSLLIALWKKRDYFLIAVWACATVAVLCFHVNVLVLVLAGLAVSPVYVIAMKRRGEGGKP
ncbi:MAG: chromate transporter [Oscillospiraceae bacterium]|nr:chromate transporter [Oscillospiraceae bacterium]